MCAPSGRYVRPAATSARRKSPIAWICGSTSASAAAQSGAMTWSSGGRSCVVVPGPVVVGVSTPRR
ncbi:hypothetical protein [Isoptericola sp. NPDC019571]|uniref:hypothetical protein n=1 Tax=Isoptericola sp. NPDC019571 TaxID=3364008 RepID=UPI0037A66875